MRTKLGRGNVVMVEAFNIGLDDDLTYLYVGEIVRVRDVLKDRLSFRTLYKSKPRKRGRYLITMKIHGESRYISFYNTDIDVLVVVKERA